ncbi:polysaccharide deacetylase family protein [uncultured Paracoccus sp.]|uniref:polysaccharide deacetylase family protein n=1 Tax=uncultured Paracoccus sp. TaxID=189685 RepID=UPI0025EBA5F8|nr:polysaccharide deacetylase family protein [uncultured Paracoccus sp.]
MPWKDNYTTSDEIGIRDEDIVWPLGRQMALALTVNLNPAATGKGVQAGDLAYPAWHFGLHEGLDAFLGLFAALGIRATFAVPALVVEAFPDRMKAILDGGHEIAAQGLYGESALLVDPATEASHMDRATEIIATALGCQPKGWFALPRPDDRAATGSVSDHTARLLEQRAYRYLGNGLADDAPYWWVTDAGKGTALLTLPYYYHFDDTFFLMFPREGTGLERPQALLRGWHAEFRAQYRRGRYFNICVSPARSGWGHRFVNLSSFLRDAMAHPAIWAATGAEIAAHWHDAFPASRRLKLEPSIWRDYEDSLS